MLSFPFNSSTAVFYFNKDAFKKAGLDPNKPPKTWQEVVAAAAKLKAVGPAVRLHDRLAVVGAHRELQRLAQRADRHQAERHRRHRHRSSRSTRPLHVQAHRRCSPTWRRRACSPTPAAPTRPRRKFFSGECAMLTVEHRRRRPTSAATRKFDWSVNFMPYYDDVKGAPQNSIIGGASLWVMGGKKPTTSTRASRSSSPSCRSPRCRRSGTPATGYVPITQAAYEHDASKSGFYDKNPGTDVAVQQLTNKPPTANSKGLRFGNFVQVRDVIEEEIEEVFAGKKDAEGRRWTTRCKRGNEILRKFEAANK